jgi:hypothetical protein
MPDAAVQVHPWLKPFPAHQRPLVAAWFGYAVSQGARQPGAVVALVSRLVADKLAWSVSSTSTELCETTLASLAHRRTEALQYAQTLLEARGAGADEPS